MSVEFTISVEKLENNQAVIRWFKLFAKECLREAQGLAGERIKGGSGRYERSFTFELTPGSPPSLRFGNVSDHAAYVEEDTDAHDIVPKNAKVLRWFDPPPQGKRKGKAEDAVFSMKVHHPGTKGMHIVEDAVRLAGERLRARQL